MLERQLDLVTPDGPMSTFIVHPERNGPHPVILFFMDAPGIREELRDMARRLATVGYYVMLPNLYHRQGVNELGDFIGEANARTREKMTALMTGMTMKMAMEDADALIAFADKDEAASHGKIGALGYCMSGQYAMNAASRHPDRVAAAASIYGVRLITDRPNSPHLTARQAKAEFYVAWAETDHYAPLKEFASFAKAFKDGGIRGEVELYEGVEHGFAFPQRPAYDKPAAERHWERLFALYARNLQ
jgi:carboxymethylenebutenolidase